MPYWHLPSSYQMKSTKAGGPTTWGPILAICFVPCLSVVAYAIAALVQIFVYVHKIRPNSSRYLNEYRRRSTSSFGQPSQNSSQIRLWFVNRGSGAVISSLGGITTTTGRGGCQPYYRPRLVRKCKEHRAKLRGWREDRRRLYEESHRQQERVASSSFDVKIDVLPADRDVDEEDDEELKVDGDYGPENSLVEMNRIESKREGADQQASVQESSKRTLSGGDSDRIVSSGSAYESMATGTV